MHLTYVELETHLKFPILLTHL